MDCFVSAVLKSRLLPVARVGAITLVTAICGYRTNALSAQAPAVAFDVPAIVVAELVNPAVVSSPTTGGELMRLRIPVSSVIGPVYPGAIGEFLVEFNSPSQSLRVVDFWPKNETYSEFEGTVSVEASREKDERFHFNLGAAYPGIGQAAASGDYRNKMNVQESYQRHPPEKTLTSSGTIQQGFGVFFKFRPGRVDFVEGSRDIAILVEAPRGWRADLLKVRMTATGSTASGAYNSQQPRIVATDQFWITTHREGDGAAAAQALAYVRQERHLRGLAANSRKEVEQRSLPSVLHKLGVALEVVDSRIPNDYLAAAIFGPAKPHFDQGTQRLPVDLRVAMLDYWDHRSQLMNLARPCPQSEALATAEY